MYVDRNFDLKLEILPYTYFFLSFHRFRVNLFLMNVSLYLITYALLLVWYLTWNIFASKFKIEIFSISNLYKINLDLNILFY